MSQHLADGTLGALVLDMAAELTTLGAAIDLALAEDEIDRIDDDAVDKLLAQLGLIAAPEDPRNSPERNEGTP